MGPPGCAPPSTTYPLVPLPPGSGEPHLGGLRGADVHELGVCTDCVPRQRGRSGLRPKLEYVSSPSCPHLPFCPLTRQTPGKRHFTDAPSTCDSEISGSPNLTQVKRGTARVPRKVFQVQGTTRPTTPSDPLRMPGLYPPPPSRLSPPLPQSHAHSSMKRARLWDQTWIRILISNHHWLSDLGQFN